jgi:hypothetical protein
MDKPTFLEMLKTNRAELESALAQVDDARMLEPGVSGEMSVKDLLAHIAWYEREMVGILQQQALAGSEWWILSSADRNTAILDRYRSQSLAEVRQAAQQAYADLLRTLETVDDAALNSAAWFREMPVEWIPWQLIADNSCEHYLQHVNDIRKWAERS